MKKVTMDNIETVEKMFSEIGLDDNSRKALKEKINFDFDFTIDQHKAITEIVTTINTKND
jgi:hypothetical protein